MVKRRYKFRRMNRPRTQTFNRLIPNIVTVGALCAGITGVRFALAEKWELAIVAILVAAVLDALDGTIARLLKTASDFGAELDSLSDVIAFGVAPALVVYFWSLSTIGGFGWAVVLFFVVCCALRLARFNSTLESLPPFAYNYFTGVPAPGGALLALLPLLISQEFGAEILNHPAVTGPWVVIIALLMVSQVPTYSLKRLRVPHRMVLPMLVFIPFLAAGIAGAPWLTLFAFSMIYLGSFPFSIRSYHRLRREADELISEADNLPETDNSQANRDDSDRNKTVGLREV